MNKATIRQIDKEQLFFKFDHFIIMPEIGKCKLVAIHGRDSSTDQFYKENPNCIRVTLNPMSGAGQLKTMLEGNTEFDLVSVK